MHPTAVLLAWLFAVLAAQYLAYAGLSVLVLVALVAKPQARPLLVQFAKRGRWLFLSLWLILAYGKPGEAVADLAWGPTLEGMAEANLQACRLLAVLACLSWLFAHLGRDGLVSALWGALRPLASLGLDVERLVVRLSLVLDHLKQPLPAGAWKSFLLMENQPEPRKTVLHLSLPVWTRLDTWRLLAVSGCFLWIVLP